MTPPPSLVRATLAVALGGAVGAVVRVLASELVGPSAPGAWPWATLLVNASGAFALGLLLTRLQRRPTPWPYLRPLLGTGVLGGYTTFSALAVETVQLGEAGRAVAAAAYALSSLVVTVLAVVLGRAVAAR